MHEQTRQSATRWRIVLICALSQNLAMGMGYGSFGPMLASNEAHFEISRVAATMGMSVLNLALGACTFLLAPFLTRYSCARLMVLGSLASAAAYFGLSLTNSFPLFLVLYAVVGAGMCLVGILGPITLINRWFEADRGKKLGIVNLPIFLFAVPALVAGFVQTAGRGWVMVVAAAAFLLLAILQYILLVDEPAKANMLPWRRDDAGDPARKRQYVGAKAQEFSDVVRGTPFWLISLGVGICSGGATAFFVHAVPFGNENGMSLETAAMLLAIYSGVGLLSPFLFGWLADRSGALVSLIVAALGQSLAWIGFALLDTSSYFALAALFGFNAVSSIALHQMVMSELIKTSSLARGYGLSYVMKIPFMFVLAPAVALVFQQTGSYLNAFLAMGLVVASAIILFFVARVRLATIARREALAFGKL